MSKSDNISWKIIDKFFNDNPQILVRHHIESFNDFYKQGLQSILKERNPIVLQKEQDTTTNEFKYRCELYLGGKSGDKVYYGKPVIYDDNREHYMYPNEARLRNMNYGITIHFDLEVEFIIRDDEGNVTTSSETFEKLYLGRFPIMLQSEMCILTGLSKEARYNMGECRNDYGGYFIIDGKEKVIISQEKFADNMLYIRDKVNDIYSHSAEIRTVSEDASKPERTLSVRIVTPNEKLSNNQIVVNVPNVRQPVPLFILMRALGIESDKKIIEYCLLDIEENSSMVDLFIPSIHDAGKIFTQETAIKYIATFTKGKTVAHVMDILSNYFLPNVGELNFQEKAYFLGYIVYKLLLVYTGIERPTDRDSFKYKRVEVPGSLMYDLFKEYYKLQQDHVRLSMDKEYNLKKSDKIYQGDSFKELVTTNYSTYFKERVVEAGFKKGFKGNWGAQEHTKKLGLVQDLNRLSYNSFISHLRKINLPMDSSAKVVKPRLLHGSQWGVIDPVDTPDGGNVGFHKHMAISSHITSGCSGYPMMKFLRSICKMKLLQECSSTFLYHSTKIMVNGSWVGVITNPIEIMRLVKKYKRCGLIPIYTSISWTIKTNEIHVYTDSGRLCRPVFYVENNKPSFLKKEILEKLQSGKFKWNELISGFADKKYENYDVNDCKIFLLNELYNTDDFSDLEGSKAIIEYIDTAEEETALISTDHGFDKHKPYTHVEIHPSLLLGVMGNQIVFPENNQLPRDLFSCGQSKQAVSLYSSNFFTRIDKMGVVLNAGQLPVVKSRYMEYINNEQHPYGENVIVAIMVYGGYNVEDSILFNEGSVKRGLFRTTYYNMYESREESSQVGENTIDSHFANVEKENVVGLKPGYDYSLLDQYGLVKENTEMNDKTVVIGKVTSTMEDPDKVLDSSVYPKKGQLGHVDKTFITEDESGFRLAKVRIREDRVPAIGDKFCSRCGQKGTVGLIIPEDSMPFTEDGVKPDIIINPHALPSRMTIGQLVESLMGKACVSVGGFGDCTAFVNKGSKHELFGKVLTQNGYHSSGNQILYNGQTGEQLDAQIFMGPTYYMRLKHMVKDKINYRARGPRTMLTRQTVGGRANDGGLRIGEMERDGVIAHGATKFLQESMLVRGDDYYMAICNNTGSVAVYNNSQNIFLSPMVDGPIKFVGTVDNEMNIEKITKHGRDFSIVRIPYAFKLLLQELQTMNIQMRVITDDNIDQLTSLSYSDNINKLTNKLKTSHDAVIGSAIINARDVLRDDETSNIGIIPTANNEPIAMPSNYEDGQVAEPESFAWMYYSYDEERGEAYTSLLLNDNGEPTEYWFVGEHDGLLPNTFPKGWNFDTLEYNDGLKIPSTVMIEELNNLQEPNNWNISLEKIRRENIGKPETMESPQYAPESPPHAPASPPYPPASPPYPPASPQYPPESPPYPPQSPDYPPPGYSPVSVTQIVESPPHTHGSPGYAPTTNAYPSGSPSYPSGSPSYPPGSPSYPPGSPSYPPGTPVYNQNSPVYNSNTPISSSDSFVPPPPPDSYSSEFSSPNNSELNINTEDNKDVEKIEKMIEQTKPKRDDGIELIINENALEKSDSTNGDNETEDGNDNGNNSDSSNSKKIII